MAKITIEEKSNLVFFYYGERLFHIASDNSRDSVRVVTNLAQIAGIKIKDKR